MKTSAIFLKMLIVGWSAALAPTFLCAQAGATQVEAKFVSDSLSITAKFQYSIESGKVRTANAAHHFLYDAPTDVQIKFSGLQWEGALTEAAKRNLVINLAIRGDSPGTLTFGMSESQFYNFSLKSNTAPKLNIQMRAILENGNTLTADRSLTLTFTSPPQPPSGTPKESVKPLEPSQNLESNKENEAWAEARRNNTVQAYGKFLSEFPSTGGKYYKAAKEAMIQVDVLKKSVKRINDSIEFIAVSNLLKAPWMEAYPASRSLPADGKYNKALYSYEFSVFLFSGLDSIRICDFDPKKKGARCLTHRIESMFQPLSGQFQLTAKGDSARLTVSGGKAPFRLVFLDPGGWEKGVMEFIQVRDTTVSLAALAKVLEPGTYAFEIQDAESAFFKTVDEPLTIKKRIPRSWLIGGAVAALLFIAALIIRSIVAFRQNRRRKNLLRQAQSNTPASPPEITPENGRPPLANLPPTQDTPAVSGSEIKIRPRSNTKETAFDVFHSMVGVGYLYFPLALEQHWQDSALQAIYMHRDAISEIGHYLRTENTSKIKENDKDIPEIGGMLLGRFSVNNHQKYEVSIDKFVPIASSASNVYSIEFSVNSMAKDLTHMLDKYPDLLVVGWFHTHPGHGLFLSPPDLSIQEHFREPYQIAMEIDSLSAALDTGFFTRKTDGSINNAEYLKPHSKWFSWREIEQFTSRRS